MRSSLAPWLALLLASAVPAAAHDWQWPSIHEWRAMRAEYQAEFARARMIDQLDCAGLDAYVAQENRLMNQWVNAEYHRPLSRMTAVSPPAVPGPAPMPTPPRPR